MTNFPIPSRPPLFLTGPRPGSDHQAAALVGLWQHTVALLGDEVKAKRLIAAILPEQLDRIAPTLFCPWPARDDDFLGAAHFSQHRFLAVGHEKSSRAGVPAQEKIAGPGML